jgi:hypothetical protein
MQDSQTLLDKITALSPEQVIEVEHFVEFLTNRARKQEALGRLLTLAPSLEDAGAACRSEDEILAEVTAARTLRHSHRKGN